MKKTGAKKKAKKQTTVKEIIKPNATAATLFGGPFHETAVEDAIPSSWIDRSMKAWVYYKEEPLVSNAINVWRIFALGDEIKVTCDNKDIENEAWKEFKRLKLNIFVKDMILQLLVKGDAMGYIRFTKEGYDIRSLASVNPVSVDVEYDGTGSLAKATQCSKKYYAYFQRDEQELPLGQFFHLKWNAASYEPRGTSMVLPAFESIELLRTYRKAERAIAKRWTTPLQLIQVGGAYGGKLVMPTQKDLDEIRNAVNCMDLKSGMVVPFYVKAETYGTKGETLNTEDKVKEIKEDILVALGLSRSIVTGDGPNFATAKVSLHKMVVQLKEIKQAAKEILDWVFGEWKSMKGFDEYDINYQFSDLDLFSEVDQKKLLLELYDRGLISKTTLQQKFGLSETLEEKRIEEEEIIVDTHWSIQDLLQMVGLGVITTDEAREKMGLEKTIAEVDEIAAKADAERLYSEHPFPR